MLLIADGLLSIAHTHNGCPVEDLIQPEMIRGRKIEFSADRGSGYLLCDGVAYIWCRHHRFWREILLELRKALDPEVYQLVRQGIQEATRLEGYQPLPDDTT